MRHWLFILALFLIPPSVSGQYSATVRFGKGSPSYSPDTAKRESTLYFDITNQRLFNWAYAKGWEVRTLEYVSGTPSNSIDSRVKFAVDSLSSPPKIYTRKGGVWYEQVGTGGGGSTTFTYVDVTGTTQVINFGITIPATAEIYMNGQLLRPPQYSVISTTSIQVNVITVKYDRFTAKF
jgi:hypothetical protein